MANNPKQYVNRRWIDMDGYYVLQDFFYDDWREVLRMRQDKEEKDLWIMSSKRMNIEVDYLIDVETLEEVKEFLESYYTEYLEDRIQYYENLLDAWEE